MGKFKNILILILFFFMYCVYANDNHLNGVWCNINRNTSIIDYYCCIEYLNNNSFFVIYNSSAEEHVLDFSGIATAVDETRLYIKVSEDRYFYIYYDSYYDNVYVLWNHDYIGDYDAGLERVTKLYDDEYQLQKKMEYENQLYQAVMDYLKRLNEDNSD